MISYVQIKQWINKKWLMPRMIKKRAKALQDQDISIISSNCIGGVISHDYGLQFKSPTINLFFDPLDFIKFVERLDYYLQGQLKLWQKHQSGYPICMLEDIKIHFVHYHSFEECIEKWNKRKKIINFNNIILMFTNQNGCTDELIERFSKLPYKKVMFSDREYPQYDFIYFIPKNEEEVKENRNPIDKIFLFKGFNGKRRYEEYFDFMQFLKG